MQCKQVQLYMSDATSMEDTARLQVVRIIGYSYRPATKQYKLHCVHAPKTVRLVTSECIETIPNGFSTSTPSYSCPHIAALRQVANNFNSSAGIVNHASVCTSRSFSAHLCSIACRTEVYSRALDPRLTLLFPALFLQSRLTI